ncbi:MAG: efflux RND transporter permease subunit [Candidatus Kapaibacterium sp.]
MTITELSIKRPTLVVVAFTILIILGLFSYGQLKYELLPKISPPFVTISTVYPGAAPQEIETSVTKPLEDAVSGLDKVSSITSTSSEGVSFVNIEFNQNANVNSALQDVIRQVNQVKSQLPTGTKDPVVSKFALDEIPVLRMGVTSSMPSVEFYQFVLDNIKPQISKIEGVGNVYVFGGNKREIQVNLDAQKVRAYGLSLTQIQQAVSLANLDFPTGKIKEGTNQYVVRVAGKYSSISELQNLVVGRSKSGGDIRLSDIADVNDGIAEITTINRINNVASIGINVQKQTDANAVDVAKLVKAQVDKLNEQYKNINLKIVVAQDGSTFTLDAAHAVQFDLMLAIFIVAFVMLIFLHSIRNSAIVMVSIPASLISTFIGVWVMGFSLNLMTMLGLSLVIGILVDDSIVVLENIYHHLEKGKDRVTASIVGRNEIGFAALSITLVDVAVFLPLSLVTGIIGNIMREFALVVVVSTLLSLLVSFTITPLLASRFAKIQELTENSFFGSLGLRFERWFNNMIKEYGKALGWSLNHRWVIVLGSFLTIVVAISLMAFGFIGFEFMTQTDRGEFSVTVEFPSGSRFENTNILSKEVENVLFSMPEVTRVISNVGSSSEGLLGQTSNNVTEFQVTLVPTKERKLSTDEIGNKIKQEVLKIPGATVRVNPIGIFGTANQTPIQVVVTGPNRIETERAAKMVADSLKTIAGATDVRLSTENGKPETRVNIDRQKLAALGLTIGEVGSALRIALQGNDDVKYREGATEYDIRIRLDEKDRDKTDELASMTVANRMGQQIEIQQFASVEQTAGPTKLQRRDRNPAVIVYAQAVGKGSGTIAGELDKKFTDPVTKQIKLTTNTTYTYAGDVKNARDGNSSMILAMLGGIIFVYLLLVALYDSYFYPFVTLFAIPGALIGAFLALALGMKNMSVFGLLGFLMLIGLVTKNAILLVDRSIANLKERNMPLREALIEAGEARLRPIVMTTLAMVFGMMPIAFGGGAGNEWKSSLALALIGGLTSSMFLTLLLVPVAFSLSTQFISFNKRLIKWIKSLFIKSQEVTVS